MNGGADAESSEKARQEGNAAFKKGKWSEAIGHYTDAVVNNPKDTAGYTNRAAAYLKLDKYEDAERDCTSALDIEPQNLKALYRRGLARKTLGRIPEALHDIEALCKLDKKNAQALEERKELRELQKAQALNKPRLAKGKGRADLPPSPPTLPASNANTISATIEEIPNEDVNMDGDPPTAPTPMTENETAEKATTSSTSFADLRKSRETKKTFVRSSSPPPAISSASEPPDRSPLRPPPVPSNPLSTSPGAGLQLLRHLTPPQTGWQALCQYPPAKISIILGPLLDPDILGQLIMALACGTDTGEEGMDVSERVRTIMVGLKNTPRWRTNVAMLSSTERQAASDVWKRCGGEGNWP